jgi:hypothetical protein
MADASTILYQMGQTVAQKLNNSSNSLLQGNNTFTGSNTFQNVSIGNLNIDSNVSIGGNLSTSGDATLGGLSTLRAATFGDNVTVNGNLTVNGTTTTISTTNTDIEDNVITLSKGASTEASYAQDSGLYIERALGSEAAAFIWDESEARFSVGTLLPTEQVLHRRYTLSTAVAGEFYYLYATGTYATSNYIIVNLNSTSGDPVYYETYGPQDELVLNLPSSIQTVSDLQAYLEGLDYTGFQYAVGGSTPNTDVSSDSRLYVEFYSSQANTNLVGYTGSAYGSMEEVIPAADASTSADDSLRVTPGELQVGGLTINEQSLGSYSDFTAGLNA